jgi:hypothetical protein
MTESVSGNTGMTDQDEISLGEIARAVKRLEVEFAKHRDESRSRFHELANTMNATLAPVSIHTIQIESQQKAIGRLDDDLSALTEKVDAVVTRSATIAGGIGVAAFVAQFIPGWLKGHP